MRQKLGFTIALSTVMSAALVGVEAQAQAAPQCPALPSTAADMQWAVMRAGDIVLCRAVDSSGAEAFSVTLSRKSPFRPERNMRAESVVIQGEETWWYRGEIAGKPQTLVREALVEVATGGVAHISIRTDDQAVLSRYQDIAQSMDFRLAGVAQR
jgi:hypothetical protein